MLKRVNKYFAIVTIALVLASCTAGENDTGVEYSPQMYHATSYEPLTQITDQESGS